MINHPSRGRISARPLGTDLLNRLIYNSSLRPRVRGDWLADMRYPADGERGWLVRLPAGNYVMVTAQGSLRSLDQDKAASVARYVESGLMEADQAKLDAKGAASTDADIEMAALLQGFVDEAGLPVSRVAQMLGMSQRTVEGILQGRGFRYPQLLTLAIQAFRSTPDK